METSLKPSLSPVDAAGAKMADDGDEEESMEAVYNVNKMFPVAANIALAGYLLLLFILYFVLPADAWEDVSSAEKSAVATTFWISTLSLILLVSTFVVHGGERKASGIIYAGCLVMLISAITNAQLAFTPTVAMFDRYTQSRVFLVRWCEWIPLSGLMTFLADAIDVPKSRKALRRAVLFSLCQSASCVAGLVFPFCENFWTWLAWMVWSCVTWAAIFPRLYEKRQLFLKTPKGKTFVEMERYKRRKHGYELMRVCTCLWSGLVIAYFVVMYINVMLPVGHRFRPEGIEMYADAAFDATAKSAYMRQILDTHSEIFHSEGLARQQLVELRKLMSVLWTSSSDLIVLSVKHGNKRVSLVSPGLAKLLQQQSKSEEPLERMALVIETEDSENEAKEDQNEGKPLKAYHIDSSIFALDELRQASISSQLPLTSEKVTVALKILKEARDHNNKDQKEASPFASVDLNRSDGSTCKSEIRVLLQEDNAMVIVVHDVTERHQRFQAERKAESEARRRQKEAQSVSMAVVASIDGPYERCFLIVSPLII